jgi:hypothetical protein
MAANNPRGLRLGALLAPLAGTPAAPPRRPAPWLACGALATAAALGQAPIAPAIRNRATLPHETKPLIPSGHPPRPRAVWVSGPFPTDVRQSPREDPG